MGVFNERFNFLSNQVQVCAKRIETDMAHFLIG